MSHTYAVKYTDEHAEVKFSHELLTVLESRDLQPEVKAKWLSGTIRHGEENSGHIVAVVSHLTKSKHDVDLVKAARKETHMCSCEGFYFHYYNKEVGAKTGDCRHIKAVKEAKRTDLPDGQTTLEP